MNDLQYSFPTLHDFCPDRLQLGQFTAESLSFLANVPPPRRFAQNDISLVDESLFRSLNILVLCELQYLECFTGHC